jgi:hypothetical protein
MIQRVIEYIIVCDALRLLGTECPLIGGTAFGGDRSQAECAVSAEKDGWIRATKRFWLCPQCAEKAKAELRKEEA